MSRDDRHPWFLYWEAYWVNAHGPRLSPRDRVLDAGGTASLFSCHLASRGAEVHSVDLNEKLVTAGNEIARAMGWNLRSACMDMADLRFGDGTFDHAYSVCVFEHLDSRLRQRALREIARVLKPGGTLSLTFDYRAPGVYLSGEGPSGDPEHLIRTPADVQRTFFSAPCLEPLGNTAFADNGKTYLSLAGQRPPPLHVQRRLPSQIGLAGGPPMRRLGRHTPPASRGPPRCAFSAVLIL